ncbi:hypothetical protein SAMN05216483_4671 [Streptomyces sp. 2131.1]|uniref:hypothetical protein n=1 Tax=Streptomyces sp. 2131.1 TaxID=1855346 RepID=UPI00089A6199|nr:hypothetical protein [Streptomyces sp. 2131.1]SED84107.1 hypothetical protein SAMN05216483_4671 [Streptomyces sp. 2131.1]
MSEQVPPGDPVPPQPPRRRVWPWVVLLVAVLLALAAGAVTAVLSDVVRSEGSRKVHIRYEVTGTARDVVLTYSTWRGEELSTGRLALRSLPWAGELDSKGFLSGGSFVVSVGRGGGDVSCAVTVDGGARRTDSASGAFATATCDGY